MSKYMLMTYVQPDSWKLWDDPSDELRKTYEFMDTLNKELIANGEMVDGGGGLTDPVLGKTVRHVPGGSPVITDGPYAETKEVFGGFWILELDSYDRAVEIATRVASFQTIGHTIEIRPFLDEVTEESVQPKS